MKRDFPAHPLVGIGAVVIKDDQVLLIKRGKPPKAGQWSLPGGAQELGERVFEGARREVKEETGIDVDVIGLIDVVDSITRTDQGDIEYHYTLVDVLCRWTGGTPKASADAADAAWHPLSGLDALGLWSETRRVITLGAEMSGLLPNHP